MLKVSGIVDKVLRDCERQLGGRQWWSKFDKEDVERGRADQITDNEPVSGRIGRAEERHSVQVLSTRPVSKQEKFG